MGFKGTNAGKNSRPEAIVALVPADAVDPELLLPGRGALRGHLASRWVME